MYEFQVNLSGGLHEHRSKTNTGTSNVDHLELAKKGIDESVRFAKLGRPGLSEEAARMLLATFNKASEQTDGPEALGADSPGGSGEQ